jgi:DNA-3-methyladenine glycosylase I
LSAEVVRCPWPGEDPLYVAYHDDEWGVPEFDSRALYEKLVLDGFQAGLSWITILRKRENFRRAFDDFEPAKIARYGERQIGRLLKDEGIVRSRAKIEAAIRGAKLWLEIEEKGTGRLHRIHLEARRRQTTSQSVQINQTGPGQDSDERRARKGVKSARIQFLRAGDRLRLRASRRHGQRPHRLVLPA